jgi:hypothetical protein
MKLLVGSLALLGLVLLGLPLIVVAVVATHPWLAVGSFRGTVQVRDRDRTRWQAAFRRRSGH